jgi:hypothetical protein
MAEMNLDIVQSRGTQLALGGVKVRGRQSQPETALHAVAGTARQHHETRAYDRTADLALSACLSDRQTVDASVETNLRPRLRGLIGQRAIESAAVDDDGFGGGAGVTDRQS